MRVSCFLNPTRQGEYSRECLTTCYVSYQRSCKISQVVMTPKPPKFIEHSIGQATLACLNLANLNNCSLFVSQNRTRNSKIKNNQPSLECINVTFQNDYRIVLLA